MFYKLILSPILQTAFPKFLPNHLSPLLPKEQIQVANGEGVLMKKKKKKKNTHQAIVISLFSAPIYITCLVSE